MNRVTIGSDNGLLPIQHQVIIWTNAGILLIGHIKTNFTEILIKMQNFSFTKMHLKISSVKWQISFPGADVLKGSLQLSWGNICWYEYDIRQATSIFIILKYGENKTGNLLSYPHPRSRGVILGLVLKKMLHILVVILFSVTSFHCTWDHCLQTVYPINYAHDSFFIVFYCDRLLINFTNALQSYFCDTGAVIQ